MHKKVERLPNNGSGQTFLRFDVFISLYAGVPALEIMHTLGINNGEDTEFLSLSSLDIPIDLDGPIASAYALSAEGARYSMPAPGCLFQSEDHRFDIADAKKIKGMYSVNPVREAEKAKKCPKALKGTALMTIKGI